MGLESTVIVEIEQLSELYKSPSAERYFQVLVDMGLLPLTVKDLTTQTGKALLNLAAWTYFSGDLTHKFRPRVSAEKNFAEYLMKNHLNDLGKRFRYEPRDENSGILILAEDGGAF